MLKPRKPFDRRPVQQESAHRINRDIRALNIRLVGENVEPGIFDTRKALNLAEELGLDLVEISPKADPPVCRIVDYKKFLYEKKKKEKEMKSIK